MSNKLRLPLLALVRVLDFGTPLTIPPIIVHLRASRFIHKDKRSPFGSPTAHGNLLTNAAVAMPG